MMKVQVTVTSLLIPFHLSNAFLATTMFNLGLLQSLLIRYLKQQIFLKELRKIHQNSLTTNVSLENFKLALLKCLTLSFFHFFPL